MTLVSLFGGFGIEYSYYKKAWIFFVNNLNPKFYINFLAAPCFYENIKQLEAKKTTVTGFIF